MPAQVQLTCAPTDFTGSRQKALKRQHGQSLLVATGTCRRSLLAPGTGWPTTDWWADLTVTAFVGSPIQTGTR